MICPQQRLQSFLNQNNNNNNNNNRNSICLELSGCSTDESSTDDYQLIKSSSNHYWTKLISSTMTDINEHEIPSAVIEESNINHTNEIDEEKEEEKEKGKKNICLCQSYNILVKLIATQFVSFLFFSCSVSSLPNTNNNSEQTSVIVPSSQSTMDVITREKEDEEKQQEQISSSTIPNSIISSSHSSSSSSSSTVILRDHAETIRTRRQCHSSISLLQHQQRQQSLSSSFEEPFYDCKQATSPQKPNQNFDMSLVKISTCTMTGKSLNNLDECSSTSSEEKGVQTTLNEPMNPNSCVKRAISSTSLSSSSASIQTDSIEKKPKMPISTTTDETTSTHIDTPTHLTVQHQTDSQYKWPHVHERLLGEQACIYWVNYLGKLYSINKPSFNDT